MKLDRILLVLVLIIVVTQGMLLFRQYREQEPAAADSDAVQDVPAGTIVDLNGLPVRGSSDASVVLVEFSDYECPFCARHANTVEPELKKQFVDSGKIRYAFANNPLSFHPEAKLLATAAICAGEQGKYWEMHDQLFAKLPKTRAEIAAAAEPLTIDSARLSSCIDNDSSAARRIDGEAKEAERLRMDGTPGFALGVADRSGHVRIRKLINGAQPLEVFRKAIAEVVAAGKAS
jgi:protein-disulfide isomerase